MGPRPHHYCFVHRLLPELARNYLGALCGAMLSEQPEQILKEWWDTLAKDLPEAERLPWPSISVDRGREGSHLLILFTFPPPEGSTEAYFSVVIVGPIAGASVDEINAAPRKYYVLEHGFSLDGTVRTVLAEWTSAGTHLNYGDGPTPSAEAFLSHIKKMEGLEAS